MPAFIDLTGQKFGRLTVLARAPNHVEPSGQQKRVWLCRCSCGVEKSVRAGELRSGGAVSCGCSKGDLIGRAKTTHGESGTAEYQAWRAMIVRCTNPNVEIYRHYGARGIQVDPRWMVYDVFLAEMGRKPSAAHSIERRDVEGNYTPDNCLWATRFAQARNTRRTHWITHDGATRSLAEWAEMYGIPYAKLEWRIRRGMLLAEAITAAKSTAGPAHRE